MDFHWFFNVLESNHKFSQGFFKGFRCSRNSLKLTSRTKAMSMNFQVFYLFFQKFSLVLQIVCNQCLEHQLLPRIFNSFSSFFVANLDFSEAENPKVNQQEVTESRKGTRNQTAHGYVRDHTSIYIYIYKYFLITSV